MIGNNRHSDRTFVSEHICGRLAPSAGHADARLLSLVLPLSPSRAASLSLSLALPLDIVPPLFPRVPSLFFIPPVSPFARSPTFALCPYSLSRSPLALVARRSSLLSSPVSVRIGTSSALLASLFLFRAASLSAAAVYNHPLAARSLARSLGPHRIRHPLPLCPAPPRASLHSSRSRPPPFPTLRLCLYPLRNRSLFFSPLSFSISLLFSRHLFRSSRRFLSPTNAFSPDVYVSSGVSGMQDVHHTTVRVRTCAPPRSSFSRSSLSLRGGRSCSDRFDTRLWGKKMGGCIVGACHRGV